MDVINHEAVADGSGASDFSRWRWVHHEAGMVSVYYTDDSSIMDHVSTKPQSSNFGDHSG